MPGDPLEGPYTGTYTYDAHGNMTRMPHLPDIVWDENDQMREVDLGGGGTAYYVYDAGGQRVRKVWEHSGLVEERIYLGAYEIYRKRDVTGLVLERETLHVMDDARRIALVETKTVDASGPAFQPVTRVRYQLGNHLGSACLEVDETGLVISYEEYHPYGTTAYRSARSGVEVNLKRYRYTGKERDEETGLYYHGARYYAPWLGRWTSYDPKGISSGPSLYWYVRDNPVSFVDPDGRDPVLAQDTRTVEQRNRDYSDSAAAAHAAKIVEGNDRATSQNRVPATVEDKPSGPPAVPILAAFIPSMALGGALRPSRGTGHPAVDAYRSLTGNSALHTQQATGGAGALIAGMSVGAAVGMRYFPTLTPIVVRAISKPISQAMHFEDPAKLEKVVMEPARQVNRAVRVVEALLTPPEPMKVQPGQGGGGGWTSPRTTKISAQTRRAGGLGSRTRQTQRSESNRQEKYR